LAFNSARENKFHLPSPFQYLNPVPSHLTKDGRSDNPTWRRSPSGTHDHIL